MSPKRHKLELEPEPECPFSRTPLDGSPENRQRFEDFLRSIISNSNNTAEDVEGMHHEYYELHASRLEALLKLGDSLPIQLGPVTTCIWEWFSDSSGRKDHGDYKLFLQEKGCWYRGPEKVALEGPFNTMPLDVSDDGRRRFEEFLFDIADDERNSWEKVQALHEGYMELHCPRLEAIRDAGIKLPELTEAVFCWHGRPVRIREGNYSISLEARGLRFIPKIQSRNVPSSARANEKTDEPLGSTHDRHQSSESKHPGKAMVTTKRRKRPEEDSEYRPARRRARNSLPEEEGESVKTYTVFTGNARCRRCIHGKETYCMQEFAGRRCLQCAKKHLGWCSHIQSVQIEAEA